MLRGERGVFGTFGTARVLAFVFWRKRLSRGMVTIESAASAYGSDLNTVYHK